MIDATGVERSHTHVRHSQWRLCVSRGAPLGSPISVAASHSFVRRPTLLKPTRLSGGPTDENLPLPLRPHPSPGGSGVGRGIWGELPAGGSVSGGIVFGLGGIAFGDASGGTW